MWRRLLWVSVLLAGVFAAGAAKAILTIEITQGVEAGLPIAVVPFEWRGKQALPQDIAAIVEADLARSGRFAAIPKDKFLSQPHEDRQVNFKDWRLIKAEALVIGRVTPLPDARYQVEFRLYDVLKQDYLAGYMYKVDASLLRTTAHQISDIIYEKLTGEPGAFNTRIAYVTKESGGGKNGGSGAVYKLQVADSDGYGAKTIVKSRQPLMSPAWSPDGKRLAYVSFEQGRSMVYVQDIASGARQNIAEFPGINSAPAWSPDGKKLALTLSKDGNAEIYVMDLATRVLTRLTRNQAIDTEPAWSPDGRYIVFTSDRAGQPQIYRMKADGSAVDRLTFEGGYNARASYSPDGESLVLVSATGGDFHIAVLSLRNNSMQVLTDTPLDESPSFAPNGRMILYATEERGQGVLASVSADGRVRQLYRFEEGDVREPAWSISAQQAK